MPTDFSLQPLRDVISSLAETTMEQGLQSKEFLRDERGALMLAKEISGQGLLTATQKEQIEKLAPGQSITLNLYKDKAAGTGTQRVRRGTGSMETATVTPSFFDQIQEGIDMSMANKFRVQYGATESVETRERIARLHNEHLQKEVKTVFTNIYERLNAQIIAYIEANKWTLTGTDEASPFYDTVTGDALNIPAADTNASGSARPLWIQRLRQVAEYNNFGREGTPFFLRSINTDDLFYRYQEQSQQNSFNVAQFLNGFASYKDNGITVSGSDLGTLYIIDSGSLIFYQQDNSHWTNHPDAVNGRIVRGNDIWDAPVFIGNDAMFPNFPQLQIELKSYAGYDDTYSTYGVDESRIDYVQNWSFVVKGGMLKSYYADSNKSPILKAVFKSS